MPDWTPTIVKLEGGQRCSAWYTTWAPDLKLKSRNAHGVDDFGVEYRHYVKDSNGAQYDRYRYYFKGKQLHPHFSGTKPHYVVIVPMTGQKVVVSEDEFYALTEK